jgi:hypothetical protein
MRFLFTSLQTYESEFYGRVGAELARRGHEHAHVTISRESARALRAQGIRAYCLPDVVAETATADLDAEVRRIEATYSIPHIRDVYYADRVCRSADDERFCVRRTVQHFRALERVFDEAQPDVVVPEVGNETLRVAAHLIGVQRRIPVLFLLYTIFPNPLRLYVDTLHAPIVAPEDVRPLTLEEDAEVEEFRRAFVERAQPIRAYHRWPLEWRRVGLFAGHVRRSLTTDRDNEYLRPWKLLWSNIAETARGKLAQPFYDALDPSRPFVYFPLHVVDDYKILKVIPHTADQASIVEQIADALPVGHDVVIKEHPMSIGRNSIRLLRRLRTRKNVRLVAPRMSTHELIRKAEAVAVISSTVGLEALLYEKPVLTIGQPFYSGYGVTLDVDSFRELRAAVPELLRFRPDPVRVKQFLHAAMRSTYPGAPVLVDRSEENAARLAESLERRAREVLEL